MFYDLSLITRTATLFSRIICCEFARFSFNIATTDDKTNQIKIAAKQQTPKYVELILSSNWSIFFAT